jgi:hypothetical protein
MVEIGMPRAMLSKLGRSVGVDDGEFLDWLAVQLFGRDLLDERDVRVGDVTELSPQSARSKRGQATRAILDELRAYVDGKRLETLLARFHQGKQDRPHDWVRHARARRE